MDGRKENFTTVIVHIKDVNDHPPIFEKTSYKTQITEEDDRGLPKKVLKVSKLRQFQNIETKRNIESRVLKTNLL